MKRAPAIFLFLLAAAGGIAGYCFYQQQQEPEARQQRRTRPTYKNEESPNPVSVKQSASMQHPMARTRFRILRSSTPDIFGSQTDDKAEQARQYAVKLEEDVTRMRTQLKTLESVQGENLFGKAAELGVAVSIQKLYSEWKQQVADRQAALHGGMDATHPKIKALDQSIAALRRQMEQASELFQANLKIQIETSQKMLADAKARATAEKPTPDPWLETQVKVISSPAVLVRAVKRLNLDTQWKLTDQQAIARMQENMEVKLAEGTNVVSLTVRDFSKTTCADIANAVRNAYEDLRNEGEAERMRRLTQNVDAQLEAQQKMVEAQNAERKALQEKQGIPNPAPPESAPAQNPTAEYATEHRQYDSQMMLLNTIRELSAHLKRDGVVEKPIEIVETAR